MASSTQCFVTSTITAALPMRMLVFSTGLNCCIPNDLDPSLVLPHNSPDINDALNAPLNGDVGHVARRPAELEIERSLAVAAPATEACDVYHVIALDVA